nr:DUF397 domain-containing protein [Streptomyces triticisoli]
MDAWATRAVSTRIPVARWSGGDLGPDRQTAARPVGSPTGGRRVGDEQPASPLALRRGHGPGGGACTRVGHTDGDRGGIQRAANNECLEVALPLTWVGIHDSKASNRRGLTVSTRAFALFIEGLRDVLPA